MELDDKICYCYDVSFRKLWHFACRHRLHRASQMTECLGAGTGCGWCIPVLQRIYNQAQTDQAQPTSIELTAEQYAEQRQAYLRNKNPKNTF